MQVQQVRGVSLTTIGAALGALGIGLASGAWANAGDGAAIAQVRLKCRTFPTEIGAEIDTRDPASDVGDWVLGLEDRGWEVATVQWDVGQKVTGFPQGYTQVCVAPVRR
jgi:hypothetical protein